jgi:hypothetical protein
MLHAPTGEAQNETARERGHSARSPRYSADIGISPPSPGNQALLRMLAGHAAATPRRQSQNVLQRKCGCESATPKSEDKQQPLLQAKLEVGAVDDPLEREADSVADDVMRGSSNSAPATIAPIAQRRISRKETPPLDFRDSALAPEEEGAPEQEASAQASVQRSPTGESISVPRHFERTLDGRIAAGGEHLPPRIGAFMGARFGREFTDVRIHRNSADSELARSIGARAFTVGNNIFFAQNAYGPESPAGRHLIAHELTHVVQQGASSGTLARKIQRQPAGPSCASYPGYDASKKLDTYNCAGLALRTYTYIPNASATTDTIGSLHPMAQSKSCESTCSAGQIKYWLWKYNLDVVDAKKVVLQSYGRDYHIVAGITDAQGKDPTNVYSKNGKRQVHGTGTGPSFRPPELVPALVNDPAETPIPDRYVKRTGITDSCFCSNC